MLTSALLLFVTWGCQPPEAEGPPPGTTDTSTLPSDTDPPTDTAPPTTDTAPPEPVLPEYDCTTVPVQPLSIAEVGGATGYHDLAFTTDGRAIGSNRWLSDLMVAPYDGAPQVFVPNIGTVEQMVWLPDGDLAAATLDDGVVRIAPSGARTPLSPSIQAYGLILGPDEQLYAADQARVHRIDPVTGDSEVILPVGALPNGTPRVIAFDLLGERLFIGTYLGSQGRIYVVDLDASLDPVGPPTVFASGVGGGSYHDAIGVDICGYLYVPDYDTRTVWRVSPDGTLVQPLVEAGGLISSDYGHGVSWGNDEGGWREDAIYLPMPYNQNKVLEVLIGVPSQHWEGIGVWP